MQNHCRVANMAARCGASLMVLGMSFAASAATYYVDAVNGSDTNNGLSTDSPWRTVSKASNRLFQPGDAVLLKRGCVWHEQLSVWSSGTEAAPITYGAYGEGAAPILNGTNTAKAKATSFYFVLGVYSQSYVTVKDLEFVNGCYPVLLYNASFVTLDNLSVHDATGAAGIYVLAEGANAAASNTVKDCTVYNITGSADSLANGNNGCGIFLYGEDASRNTVIGNTVHDCGHEGIVVLAGSYNVIAGNTVYRSGQSGIRVALETATGNLIEDNRSYENALTADDRFGIDLIRVGNDNVVRYNVVHDQHDTLNDAAIGADTGNDGQKYGTGGIRFDGGNWEGHDFMDSTGNQAYYNTVYNEGCGIESFNFSNVSLFNNTVYNSRTTGISVQSVFATVCANNVIRNNIVHTAGSALVYLYRMDNTTVDNNVYYPDGPRAFLWHTADAYRYCSFETWQQLSGQDADSMTANPRFANPGAGDFSVDAYSPCIDSAADLGQAEDIAGTAVPQGDGADVGATEFVQEATYPTATLTSSAPEKTNVSTVPVVIEFSEPVTGFTSAGLIVSNATVDAFEGSGTTYTFNLIATNPGVVSVSVTEGAALSQAGYPCQASETLERTYELTPVNVTITSSTFIWTMSNPIPVTVTFSKPVDGFSANDLVVANAIIASFEGSGDTYTFNLIPVRGKIASASIAAGVVADDDGNPNRASGAFRRFYFGV